MRKMFAMKLILLNEIWTILQRQWLLNGSEGSYVRYDTNAHHIRFSQFTNLRRQQDPAWESYSE